MTPGDEDPRYAEVRLGVEIEAFLGSPVGRLISRRAKVLMDVALSLLASADPEDAKGIRELQNQHWRASTVMGWLVEAIREGAHAEADLTAE